MGGQPGEGAQRAVVAVEAGGDRRGRSRARRRCTRFPLQEGKGLRPEALPFLGVRFGLREYAERDDAVPKAIAQMLFRDAVE